MDIITQAFKTLFDIDIGLALAVLAGLIYVISRFARLVFNYYVVNYSAFSEKKAKRIFFSYSSFHSEDVHRIAEILNIVTPVSLDKWFLKPGKNWSDSIDRNIVKSNYVFVFWCNHAAISTEVNREIEIARDASIDVIPILLDSTKLPEELAHIHGITSTRGMCSSLGDSDSASTKNLSIEDFAPDIAKRMDSRLRWNIHREIDSKLNVQGSTALMEILKRLNSKPLYSALFGSVAGSGMTAVFIKGKGGAGTNDGSSAGSGDSDGGSSDGGGSGDGGGG